MAQFDVSSLDLFDVSLREMFLPNRTVDDNTIEVREADIPVTPRTKRPVQLYHKILSSMK
jgi:hypothetical protein